LLCGPSWPDSALLVKDINQPTADSSLDDFEVSSGILYYAADDGQNGTELWRSDGTDPGTFMLKDIRPAGSSTPSELTNVGGIVYFRADDGINGVELWKTNGTESGTVMVKDIHPSGSSTPPIWRM